MAPTGVCPFYLTRDLVLHTLLTLLLVLVQSTQGIILDYFIIAATPISREPYFWIISDFIIMFCFCISMYHSFSYHKSGSGKSARAKTTTQVAEDRRRPSLLIKYRSIVGYHPLTYCTWGVYSIALVARIAIIFKSEILNTSGAANPELIKIAVALTAVVFFLFVEGHYKAECNSKQALYIASLTKGTAFEVFDSITFLSLLIVSDTKMVFSYNYENLVIAFGCITLLLPTVCFYKLSHNDYGKVTTHASLSLLYKGLHLILVNIPYMVLRIYLWATMGTAVSMFIVKNVLNIILAIIDCKTDFIVVVQALKLNYSKGNQQNVSSSVHETHLEMLSEKENLAPNVDKSFIEVDLRSDSNDKHSSV